MKNIIQAMSACAEGVQPVAEAATDYETMGENQVVPVRAAEKRGGLPVIIVCSKDVF
ncbi:MAG: hypothetical protein ACJ8AG_04580 [Ktedonobacteraceae bacterium]